MEIISDTDTVLKINDVFIIENGRIHIFLVKEKQGKIRANIFTILL